VVALYVGVGFVGDGVVFAGVLARAEPRFATALPAEEIDGAL
jgi:hypothetical protein